MKKILLLLVIFIFSLSVSGQGVLIQIDIDGTINKKITKQLNKGVSINSIIFNSIDENNITIILSTDKGEIFSFSYSNNKKFIENIDFERYSVKNFWKYLVLKENVYNDILKNGFQSDMRYNMEKESLDYLNFLESNDAFHKDIFLNDYLQSMILRFYPKPLNDGRIGQLNVKILKNNLPYSTILPNGTILVSIGLLTTINSEEELISILANQVVHFVLDHHVQNVSQTIKKSKEEVWGNLSNNEFEKIGTELTIENDIFLDPSLIQTSSMSKFSITSEFNDLAGTNYSLEQDLIADFYTNEVLKILDVKNDALASALEKIIDYNNSTGNFQSFTINGTYPNINERINQFKKPSNNFKSVEYDKKISSLLSLNAFFEYNAFHYKSCESLINRIIEANSAFEEDLILKTLINLALYNTNEKNKESLELIEKAKTIDINPDGKIFKYETILHIRNDDSESAQQSLTFYIATIENHINEFDKTLLTSKEWTSFYNNLKKELIWAKKLLFKIYE